MPTGVLNIPTDGRPGKRRATSFRFTPETCERIPRLVIQRGLTSHTQLLEVLLKEEERRLQEPHRP